MTEMRFYKQGDEVQILELFEICFGKKLSSDYWHWRFAKNPIDLKMILLMWDADKLVGHYAMSPVMIQCENAEVLTALSMTTMTHPDYSGRGIFKDLAEELYQSEHKNHDLEAVWGFPNNNSHYGFIKNLGWSDLEQVPMFSADFGKFLPYIDEVVLVKEFTNAHALASASLKHIVSVKKSPAYLNWRYISNPAHEYTTFELRHNEINYYCVTKLIQSFSKPDAKEIDILEWELPADLDLQKKMLSIIANHYQNRNVLKLNMWMRFKDSRHIQLEKLGFNNTSPVTYIGIKKFGNQDSKMMVAENWQHAFGNSDVF